MLGRVALATVLLLLTPAKDIRKYSRSGSVAIRTVQAAREGGGQESILEFFGKNEAALCTLDFTSDDGLHGFGVGKSAWTKDGRFFVWNMDSSGGHQPWHTPTMFFDSRTSRVRNLDAYGISPGVTGEFRLLAANSIEVVFYNEEKSRRYSLAEIVESRRDVPGQPCSQGRRIRY